MDDVRMAGLTVSYYQFGPLIGCYKLPKEFVSELQLRSSKTFKDHSHLLAGHIDKENSFYNDDRQWFLN